MDYPFNQLVVSDDPPDPPVVDPSIERFAASAT
jgi:hypothetical protein